MPVIQKTAPIDQLFHEVENKIIVNRLRLQDIEFLKNAIRTEYADTISLVPSCLCGQLQGGYLKGEICPRCNSPVKEKFTELKPVVWYEKLADDLPFLSPYLWASINLVMGKTDSLRWLADTTYNPGEQQPYLYVIKDIIGGRGYRNVINNLDTILNYLKGHSKFKKPDKQLQLDILLDIVTNHKDKIFSNYLPALNNDLFVIEKNNKDIYTSEILGSAYDVAIMVLTVINNPRTTDKRREITTAKVIAKTAELAANYIRDNFAGKTKLIRKHIYGTRAHFTARAVITSISGKHDYNELHVPWSVAVPLFRPHLLNKLIKRGYNYRDAHDKILAASTTVDMEIKEVLDELIQESPYTTVSGKKGIPVLFHRNQI